MTKLYKPNEEINITISKESGNQSEDILKQLNENVKSISDLKPESPKVLNEDIIFNRIKEIFTKEGKVSNSSNKVFFTSSAKNSKHSFTLENTIFTPKLAIVLSPRTFEEKYLRQLEGYIYTSKETIDVEKLYAIVYLFSFINRGLCPIYVNTNKYKNLLNRIVFTLNKFFNKNYSVIKSIYVMFNSLKDTVEEEKDAQQGTNTV